MTTALTVQTDKPILADPPICSLEQWAARGGEIVNAHEESRWALAIWWEYGERHYQEAVQVAEDLGVSGNYLHKAHYVIRQVRNLPLTEGLTRIPFWTVAELCGRGIDADDLALLVGKCLEAKWTQEQARAIRQEFQKQKALPPVEQPKFTNGLADKPVDDGLPLAPHGATRNYFDVKHPMEGGPDTTVPLTMEHLNAVLRGQDGEAGTSYMEIAVDGEATEGARIALALSPECRVQIDLLRRYYKQPDMTAAQVIERAIGQLSTILKKRLARLEP